MQCMDKIASRGWGMGDLSAQQRSWHWGPVVEGSCTDGCLRMERGTISASLSSLKQRTRCAALPPTCSAIWPSTATGPLRPAPPISTCRMGTTASTAPGTATRDAASLLTCSAGGSTGQVAGRLCSHWHGLRMPVQTQMLSAGFPALVTRGKEWAMGG